MSTVSTPRRAAAGAGHRRGGAQAWLFCAPFLVLFAVFLVWPVVDGLRMSFTTASLTGKEGFAGLANYAEALGDPAVWSSLRNTVVFTLLSTVPLVVVSFVMAYVVYVGTPAQWLLRLAYFAPYLLPVSVVTLLWGWLFQPEMGLITFLTEKLGMEPINWLTDEKVAMWAIAVVTVWWTVGFNFLLYLSALQAVPEYVHEAAQIDGAGPWRRLRSVTLPMVAGTTGLVVLLQILASLKVFEQIYLLTAGGPNGSTRSVLEYIYDIGFSGYRLGYASAISYLFFLVILLVSLVQFTLARRQERRA